MLVELEVHMGEEDLELQITTDAPGEDELEEDTFHRQADNTNVRPSGQAQQSREPGGRD